MNKPGTRVVPLGNTILYRTQGRVGPSPFLAIVSRLLSLLSDTIRESVVFSGRIIWPDQSTGGSPEQLY